MGSGWKTVVGVAAVAVAATAAAAFAQTPSPGDGDEARPKARHHRMHKLRHNMVTGEFKVQTEDGFATIKVDRGEVTAVGDDSLTLRRADGVSVTVPVSDETKIAKGRERVELGDIEVGDKVHTMQRNDGDGFTTVLIKAWTGSADEPGAAGARFAPRFRGPIDVPFAA